MQAKNSSFEQDDRSVTATARRAQIVAHAIETIAELGYVRTSFAQIARRAKLTSTGLISYHFTAKEDLLAQVVTEVMDAFAAFVQPRVEAETTARGIVGAYIEASLEFVSGHRTAMLAVLDIVANARGPGGEPPQDRRLEADLVGLERVLRRGQAEGELRAFDVRIMALAIRSARDGLVHRLAVDPQLDLHTSARELVALFDHAIRKVEP
jgi:AcrR family transcriptional regulator